MLRSFTDVQRKRSPRSEHTLHRVADEGFSDSESSDAESLPTIAEDDMELSDSDDDMDVDLSEGEEGPGTPRVLRPPPGSGCASASTRPRSAASRSSA